LRTRKQYDEQYRNREFKIGSTLQLRLPTDYVVGLGATITPQATVEQQRPLVVGTQANVSASFTSADFALKIDDFADRFLAKMMNNLGGYIAKDVMSAVEGCPNLVSNFDGSANVTSPTMNTWLAAGALLDNMSADRVEARKAILSPVTMARTVSSLSGLFNPQPSISEQYKVGAFGGTALGVQDWRVDQTVRGHLTGSATTAAVSGGSQTGTTLTISALSGTFKAGDIVTIAGVNAVNRVTKDDTGASQQFVITADASNGATTLSIYPAITPVSGTPNTVQYATVTASPISTAVITPALKASVTVKKNLVFRKEAFALVMADLPLIRNGVVKSARESFDGCSLRLVEGFDVINDLFIDRFDSLYGYTMPRPEWCVIVCDIP